MWGNRPGWIIAGVLAALILAPVAWMVRAGRMSAPTGIGLDPENLKIIQLPIQPEEVWPIATQSGDAGAMYRMAIVASPNGDLPESIKLLLSARHLKSMTLFSSGLADVVNYDTEHPRLDKLFAAGEWSYRIGLSMNLHGNAVDAAACEEATFALG